MEHLKLCTSWISLVIILLSASIHIWRMWQGRITLNLMTWVIWSVNVVVLTWSYIGANPDEHWYAFLTPIGSGVYPLTGLYFAIKQYANKETRIEISALDWTCLAGVVIALGLLVQGQFMAHPLLIVIAHFAGVTIDLLGLVPTIPMVWKDPMLEKPLPWVLFSAAFALSLVSLESYSATALVFPLAMVIAPLLIAVIQIVHRIRYNIRESWY